jgi:hypothetical protein
MPQLKPVSLLKLWMRNASAEEQQMLATRAGTSRGQLYQVSNGHRSFSPQKAMRIAAEAKKMHRASGGRLPMLYQTDLSTACAGCAFAQKCLGPMARRAEFPVVTAEMVGESEGASAV